MRNGSTLLPKLKASAGHSLLVLLCYSLLFLVFFSPALLSGSLIGPADNVFFHQPYFYAEKVLWDTLLSSGFPMMADPQVMTFYPPAFLFSLLPGGWNLFVISAYVLASCFTYGYVHALTGSKLAAGCGGIIYGMSGFMVAQLDHATIIHNAAWLPLIIWSLEMLRRRASAFWFAAGCVGVACCALGGHSQIFVYSMVVSGFYALVMGRTATIGRLRFYSLTALMFLLGVGLAAVQIIPTLELVSHTLRAEMTFQEFITYALPARQSHMILFPALFGGLPEYGREFYFGEWNLIELTGYVGLASLLLAAVGFVTSRRNVLALFWLAVGVLAILLALGDTTPIAYITYRIPIINLFRVPARHFFELAFATSVLAGLGLTALREGRASRALVLKTSAAAILLMSLCLISLPLTHLNEQAARKGVAPMSLWPWKNAAIGVPVLLLLISVAALIYWQSRHASLIRGSLFMLIVVLDLASFGWFYARYYVAPKSVMQAPEYALRYGAELRATNQRMVPVDGVLGPITVMPPNISRFWGVPSASAHGPLVMTQTSQLLSMSSVGNLYPPWKDANNRSLDVMAIRYAFTQRYEMEAFGTNWLKEDLNLSFGAGCNTPHVDSVKIELPAPVSATHLGIVSLLGCSVDVPNGAEMLSVTATDVNGRTQSGRLRAGMDTSEWAYDCEDVRKVVLHGRAWVFSDFEVERGAGRCTGHNFQSRVSFKGLSDIKSIEFKWVGEGGALTINKLSLFDERTGQSRPLAATRDTVADWTRWRHVEDIGETSVYENLRAMPRAWLVGEVLNVTDEEALRSMKESRLPDGRAFDPVRTALIDGYYYIKLEPGFAGGRVEVVNLSSSYIELRTESESRAFLVLSDIYYPGWRASVDGQGTQLFRTNYALRGLEIPAGNHTIRLEFKPKSLYYGLLLSSLSLVVIIITIFLLARRGGPQKDSGLVSKKSADVHWLRIPN